ncbi:uncharacterized protein Dwil_GK21698 [Drosophila willistoni]|uniref:GK21698 n=1 Tax=Drosophila willistoni TaxID=7260 RepID=B4MPG6_DROWI|nr:protein no-on-transient A [Drosophila willistoni]EDW74005.1 uncharacterized protein Dwil_GK21698 [Drosophila willistoni]
MANFVEEDDSIDLTEDEIALEKVHSYKNGGESGDKMNSDDFRGETPRNRKRPRGGAGAMQNKKNLDNNSGNFGHENAHSSQFTGQKNDGPQNFGQKLRQLSEPTLDLEPIEDQIIKFSGRSRLYIGNLGANTKESDLRELFKPFGEIDDIFSNPRKNFTFLRVDLYDNAVKAKLALDGSMYDGRQLRVSFAPKASSVRVSNLNGFVSNELLYKSFEIFGPIERATIKVDDRGKSLGEGYVDFVKNSTAKMCLRMCQEKCFFLTASLRPCVVEPKELIDTIGGLPENSLNKRMPDFIAERSVGPRFAEFNTFEHDYGGKWKILHNEFKMKQEELKRELRKEEDKLMAQLEYIRNERETNRLREELRQREVMQERQRLFWEMHRKRAEDEVPQRDLRRQRQGHPYQQDDIDCGNEPGEGRFQLDRFIRGENKVPLLDLHENAANHNRNQIRQGHPYQQDDIDYGNEPGEGRFQLDRFFRGENKVPLLDLNENDANRHKNLIRIVRQGNEMQRYQQEGDHFGANVYNSTPFDVFGNVSNHEDVSVPQNDTDERLNTSDDFF